MGEPMEKPTDMEEPLTEEPMEPAGMEEDQEIQIYLCSPIESGIEGLELMDDKANKWTVEDEEPQVGDIDEEMMPEDDMMGLEKDMIP